MKTAIIIHGMPKKESYYKDEKSQSNSHWLPWIQNQLIQRDILAQTPEMPVPYEPAYDDWKKVFDQFLIDQDTILIGHSCGGGFILRYLSENDMRVGKVVLIAPWIDTNKILHTGMFDFVIDEALVKKTSGITIFTSTDDSQEIQDSLVEIKNKIKNLKIVPFDNMGHFCLRDMNTEEFPELLTEIIA